MVSKAVLDEITRRLVEQFHPRAIILFGSQARGTAREASDVDLIVVCDSFENRNALEASMYRALRGVDVPVDLLVYSQEELAAEGAVLGTVVGPAMREGRVLHGRAA